MAQQQKTKTRAKTEEQSPEEIPTEVNETSAEISEETCCVLDSIDEALEDHTDRELTDQEIYDAGRPTLNLDWDHYNSLLEEDADAAAAYYSEAYAVFAKEYERYQQAYFNVTGVEFNPCTCG